MSDDLANPYDRILSYYPRLRRVTDYVLEHLSEEIQLADAARVACLSPKYFSKYFSERMGLGFHDWLTHLRLERARLALDEQDCSITRLAFDVGFSELRTFERRFRSRFGIAPREYRRRRQDELRKHLPSRRRSL